MLNIIMISLLISLIINYFSKKPITNLNCGIFAWVGEDHKQFNPLMFNILGVYNDNRGGDSCGVFFNKSVIHGIGANAKYVDLVKTQKLHTTVRPGKWPVVLGHCRKASVGAVSSINVQPIEIREDETNKLLYTHAHNGTISNYKELAAKYKIEYGSTESDSVVMARIIEEKGFDVLAEYEGSAALVMYLPKEPNTLYAFHGESKNYNSITEERPLHYMQFEGGGTYISSEAAPLEFIGNGAKATSFKNNVLYKLKGSNVEEVRTIERSTAYNKKPVTTSRFDNEMWDPVLMRWVPRHCQNRLPFRDKGSSSAATLEKNICIASVFGEENVHNKISYVKGAYRYNSMLAHGKYVVDAWGYLIKENEKATLTKFVLFFIYGILMIDEDSYDEINAIIREKKVNSSYEFYNSGVFDDVCDKLYYFSIYPFTKQQYISGSGLMEETAYFGSETKTQFYTGEFSPIFSSIDYEFKNGDFSGYLKNGHVLTLTKFLAENDCFSKTEFAETLDDYNRRKEQEKRADELLKKCNNDDKIIYDCGDCLENSLDDSYNRCFVCQCEFGKTTVKQLRESPTESPIEKEKLVALIKDNLPPIVDDLEQLVGDLGVSGQSAQIKNQYDIIVKATEDLKKIEL